jgi:N-acetyl-gamma-glutamyl-phosphate reductase
MEQHNRDRLPIALCGATGYAGQVLHALLLHHPRMRPVVVDPRESAAAIASLCHDVAAAALALPDETALAISDVLVDHGVKVIDLSSAQRTKPAIHYGLPELFGAPPAGTTLVTNPGCYPTATLLATVPLVRAALVEPSVSVVGCSGTSGAGKALRDDLHFSELFGNFFPYKVGQHKHSAEIACYFGGEVSLVTQLVPIVRGLGITAFVRTAHEPADLLACLQRAYADAPWITVLEEPGEGLGVRHVVGTHQAVLAVGPRKDGGVVPVFAAIDNLMRGAASQALHNLELWLDLPVGLGLPAPLVQAPVGTPGMSRALV